eukprot:15457866-Alexandrium_andersonii.AAC.1
MAFNYGSDESNSHWQIGAALAPPPPPRGRLSRTRGRPPATRPAKEAAACRGPQTSEGAGAASPPRALL